MSSKICSEAVILANGCFPQHPNALSALRAASVLVCCDGAVKELLANGLEPNAIVGDMDSIPETLRQTFAHIIFANPDQYTNDLTKAVNWCFERNILNIKIVGATGKREDHTLGNISLLVRYARLGVSVEMLTDTGVIVPALQSSTFQSFKGQQVSFFSTVNATQITTQNLLYPLCNQCLPELWNGTLNECTDSWFRLDFHPGPLIVYRKY